LVASSALVLGTLTAHAGGIERTAFNPAFLFEKGNWAEFSLGRVAPDVSGTQQFGLPLPGTVGGSSGDVAVDYANIAGAVKFQLNDQWALGLIVDQPIGAAVDYSNPAYVYGVGAGSEAEISSMALTFMAHYRFSERVSVYGGIKGEAVEGSVALFNGYRLSTDRALDYGVVVGAAYEVPDIALRVALTYTSDITHTFEASEVVPGVGPLSTSFSSTVPQSLALDFQSGIAKDTLLFGSIRWRDWSEFNISPVGYALLPGDDALVSYENDSVTYTLGVGRRFSETWSGAVSVSHEATKGGFAGNLGPTDGYTSIGVGATYTQGLVKVTGGVSYAVIGDANTEVPITALAGNTLGQFTDNSLVGFGVKVGWSF